MKDILNQLLLILHKPLIRIGNITISVALLINLILLFLIILLSVRLIKLICKRWLLEKLGFDLGNREAISTLTAYFFGIIITIIFLQASGIDFTSLAVIVGGLGIGIGFGFQNITRDFTSGLILLFYRRIKVGDFIEFGKRQEFSTLKGTVNELSLLSTIIQTNDGASLVVPNSYLVENPILNWSYDNQKNRLRIPIKVNKDCDIVILTETILNTAYRESCILQEPVPQLIFINLGQDFWEFELQVWIKEFKLEEPIKSTLNYSLEYHLRQQGIELISPLNNWLTHPEKLISLRNGTNPNNFSKIENHLAVKDLLKKVQYFSNFNELEILKLIQIGYLKRLDKNEILFNEGEPGDAFYIVLSGSVDVFIPKIETRLTTLQTGAFFGELSLLLGIPRTASVKAIESSVLFAINSQGFKQILSEQPELYEVVVNELGKHQEEITQRQQQLRALGLIDNLEDDTNLVLWLRKRLNRLFR